MTNIDPKKIDEILTRGVERVYPSKEALAKVLKSGKRIRLYCGYDPSSPKLHIGSSITFKKLGQFQKLGHEVIMLIGDFTGMIGDPTYKTATRKKLSREEVLANSKNYKKYASRFIGFSGSNPAKIKYNSEWSDKLSFADLIEIASNFTVQQMIIRDMFQERLRKNRPIHIHEFLYPIAQGYDSVVMDVDLEIGGNDQTFNMLAGRDLMKIMKNKEKFVLTMKLLTDPTGKKMGKTEGNVVNMDEKPNEMFGKIMRWPDALITPAFELLTDISDKEIKDIATKLKKGAVNPRDVKAKLAREITSFYHGKNAALKAEKEFNRVFKQREAPSEIPAVSIKGKNIDILELLLKIKLAPSKSEARRLIEQKGVKIDGKIQSDWRKMISPKRGMIVQVGKRKFAKIS